MSEENFSDWKSSNKFVRLSETLPSIIRSIRYSSEENFTGKRIDGYFENDTILTKEAAEALKIIEEKASELGYSLVVYDIFRPQKAVDNFVSWSKDLSEEGLKMKEKYYPYINKLNVFELGYIAEKSSHSKGSTVDLTLISKDKNLEKPILKYREIINNETNEVKKIPYLDDNTLDMGSSFDLFDEISHIENSWLTEEWRKNRSILQNLMTSNGFESYENEWWHFSLINNPYPSTYFNFDIKFD